MILSSYVQVVLESADGSTAVLNKLSAYETFGEMLVLTGMRQCPATVQAAEDTEILFVNYENFIGSSIMHPFHAKLRENMFKSLLKKQ